MIEARTRRSGKGKRYGEIRSSAGGEDGSGAQEESL
jgi:hypothetical protein